MMVRDESTEQEFRNGAQVDHAPVRAVVALAVVAVMIVVALATADSRAAQRRADGDRAVARLSRSLQSLAIARTRSLAALERPGASADQQVAEAVREHHRFDAAATDLRLSTDRTSTRLLVDKLVTHVDQTLASAQRRMDDRATPLVVPAMRRRDVDLLTATTLVVDNEIEERIADQRNRDHRLRIIELIARSAMISMLASLVLTALAWRRSRDHALRGLVEERRQRAAMLEGVADAVVALDRDGRIVNSNPAAATVLDREAEGVLSVRLADLLRPHDADVGDLLSTVASIERAAGGPPLTICLTHRDGRELDIEVMIAPPPVGAGHVAHVVILRDVTARARVARMQEQFVDAVTHELRTPLTSLRASLGLLQSGALGELDERPGRAVQLAHQNVGRILAIVDDVLEFRQMSRPDTTLTTEVVDVPELVADAVADAAGAAAERSIDLRVTGPTSVHALLDAARMRTILHQLLDNAVRFTPDGSTVEIEITCDGRDLQLAVQDAGPGIAPEDRQAVFERFYQPDESWNRETGGTGLGLAICQRIATLHGGTIAVADSERAGARLVVSLPGCVAAGQPSVARAASANVRAADTTA